MVKGQQPKLSNDPSEERMFTWRYLGSIHNRLIKVTSHLRMSLNRFVHLAVVSKLEEEESKIDDNSNRH